MSILIKTIKLFYDLLGHVCIAGIPIMLFIVLGCTALQSVSSPSCSALPNARNLTPFPDFDFIYSAYAGAISNISRGGCVLPPRLEVVCL